MDYILIKISVPKSMEFYTKNKETKFHTFAC